MNPLVTLSALVALVLFVVLARHLHHRRGFAATIRRRHPELAHLVDVDNRPLARVAGRAVDVEVTPVRRELARITELV